MHGNCEDCLGLSQVSSGTSSYWIQAEMTPVAAINALDRALSIRGQDAALERPTGNNQAWITVNVRCMVAGYQPHELTETPGSGIQVGDSKVILSPTQINEARWPGGFVLGSTTQGDQRVPKPNIDRMIISGKTRSVISADPLYVDNILVRLEIQVR